MACQAEGSVNGGDEVSQAIAENVPIAIVCNREPIIEYVKPPPEELVCSICLQVLCDPTLTSCCGQHFCSECIGQVIARGHVCPLCKEKGFETFLNKEKLRKVNELEVYCSLKAKGCSWVGRFADLDCHLNAENGDCGFVEIECEFSDIGCTAKMPRKDLESHSRDNMQIHLQLMSREQRSDFEKALAQRCFEENFGKQRIMFEESLEKQRVYFEEKLEQQRVYSEQMMEQQRICFEQKIEEQRVHYERLAQKGIDEKIDKQHLFLEQKLIIEQASIQQKLQEAFEKQSKTQEQIKFELQQLQDLNNEKYAEQMTNTVSDLKEKMERQSKDYDQRSEHLDLRMKIKDHEIEELKKTSQNLEETVITRMDKVKKQLLTFMPVDFTMTNFAQHKRDADIWHSQCFYTHLGGYRMCLRVRANGHGRGEGTHVSVYACLMRGEFDDNLKWPFRGDITIQLLNQREEEKHNIGIANFDDDVKDDVAGRVVRYERAPYGRGIGEFILYSALGYNPSENTEYLVDDCLKLRVNHVKLTHPKYACS